MVYRSMLRDVKKKKEKKKGGGGGGSGTRTRMKISGGSITNYRHCMNLYTETLSVA